MFKSVAVAIRRATAKNNRVGIPSTKDVLWLNWLF
jgi:imidazoleglycerol phosphate dehydratase HisB